VNLYVYVYIRLRRHYEFHNTRPRTCTMQNTLVLAQSSTIYTQIIDRSWLHKKSSVTETGYGQFRGSRAYGALSLIRCHVEGVLSTGLDDRLQVGDFTPGVAAIVHSRMYKGEAAFARGGEARRQWWRPLLRRDRGRQINRSARSIRRLLELPVELEDATLQQQIYFELRPILGLDGLQFRRVFFLRFLEQSLLVDQLHLLPGVLVLELGQARSQRFQLQCLRVQLTPEI
jgi:hypothetical protein